MRTSEVLRAARRLYKESPSHVPMGAYPDDGTYCAITAVQTVDENYCGIALEALYEESGFRRFGLIRWNAASPTALVLELFDRAIAAEEAKENPTPAADETLSIMAACDTAAELVADAVMRQEPDYHRPTVLDVARTELFLAAQDTARYFPPISDAERDVFAEGIRAALEGSA